MSEAVIGPGQNLTVIQLDRRFGGRRKTILRVDGNDGSVTCNYDVSVNGKMTVQGAPITGAPPIGAPSGPIGPPHAPGSSGTVFSETLSRPLALSRAPTGAVLLYINGQLQFTSDYSLDPNTRTITWLSPDFTVAVTDRVEAVYQI